MAPLFSAPRLGGSPEGLQLITCPVFEKGAPRASLLSLGRSNCLSSKLHLFRGQDPPLPHSAHPGFTGGGVGRGRAGKSCTVYYIATLSCSEALCVNNKGVRHLLLLNTCSRSTIEKQRTSQFWGQTSLSNPGQDF